MNSPDILSANKVISTSVGPIQLSVFSGNSGAFSSENPDHPQNLNALILMFSVTSRESYKEVPICHKEFEKSYGHVSAVLVGNKVDCEEKKVKSKQIMYHRKKNIQFYHISAKCNYNL